MTHKNPQIFYNPPNSEGGRWVENVSKGLRLAGYVQEYRHSPAPHLSNRKTLGWYCDNFQDETLYPVVYRLPSREGPRFAYGYADPWNDDCAFLRFNAESADDAQRWACSVTKSAAESMREDGTRAQAGMRLEDIANELRGARSAIIEICAEARAARRAEKTYPKLCAAIRAKVRDLLDNRDRLYNLRDKIAANPWESLKC